MCPFSGGAASFVLLPKPFCPSGKRREDPSPKISCVKLNLAQVGSRPRVKSVVPSVTKRNILPSNIAQIANRLPPPDCTIKVHIFQSMIRVQSKCFPQNGQNPTLIFSQWLFPPRGSPSFLVPGLIKSHKQVTRVLGECPR